MAVATVRISSVNIPPTATVFSPDRDRVGAVPVPPSVAARGGRIGKT
ncbi:MAG TPA: hypothetical protein VIY29_09460 [Ktedonobacteraceae bacterium]